MSPSLLIFILPFITLLLNGGWYIIDYQMTSNYDSIVWNFSQIASTVHKLCPRSAGFLCRLIIAPHFYGGRGEAPPPNSAEVSGCPTPWWRGNLSGHLILPSTISFVWE